MAAEIGRDFRILAKEGSKGRPRLMQQHAKPIDDLMAAFLCLLQKIGHQRHIDNVIHSGIKR